MSKIENLVRDILLDNGIKHAPVPVEEIARNSGAEIVDGDFDNEDNISGMLFKDSNHAVISINTTHHPNRRRFTIAHELGHLVLHTGELFVDRVSRVNASKHYRNHVSSLAVDRKEIEANTFAANLLMPKDFIHSETSKIIEDNENISSDDLIDKLAAIFRVSSISMEYRLENLGIIVRQD